jgi:hypothetical protein
MTELICNDFPEACWFHFTSRAIELLKRNKCAITMQQILRKLIAGIKLPLFQGEIRDRVDLVRSLDSQLKLTHVCISSYVDFKRETLETINTMNFVGQENDNLETMSSLDDTENDEIEPDDAPGVQQRIHEEVKEALPTNQIL